MRIAIAEDRPDDRVRLNGDITRWAREQNIPLVPAPALFGSGEALLSGFSAGKYDVIFLDIFMGDINGLETARLIRKSDRGCRLIFITESADFAVDSYEVDSTWYLLKPYTYDKLIQALGRCEAHLLEQTQSVLIPLKNGEQKILLHQIAWTEYVNRQICIHLKNGLELYTRMRQRELSPMLLQYPYFCDCIKGILVNFEFVEKLADDRFVLLDGKSLPISRLKYRQVRERFFDYSFACMRH